MELLKEIGGEFNDVLFPMLIGQVLEILQRITVMSAAIQDFLEKKGMFVEYSIIKDPKMSVCTYISH